MAIATRAIERIGLAPVQERVENHVDITHAFDQARRDNAVQLKLLHTSRKIDNFNDIRRRFLLRDLYESLAILETYCDEDGSRSAFENLNACARAYIDFERRDERSEDEDRRVLTSAVAREVHVYGSASEWSRKITPACTGEQPEPAA